MEKEELEKIILKIETENSKEKAFFGIHNIEAGDELFIKANKSGLELFASELLRASKESQEIIENNQKNIIPFNPKDKWIVGDIWIAYIEPKQEDRIDIREEPYIRTWKDKVLEYFIFTILGLIVLIFIAGVKAVFNWFVYKWKMKNLFRGKFSETMNIRNIFENINIEVFTQNENMGTIQP